MRASTFSKTCRNGINDDAEAKAEAQSGGFVEWVTKVCPWQPIFTFFMGAEKRTCWLLPRAEDAQQASTNPVYMQLVPARIANSSLPSPAASHLNIQGSLLIQKLLNCLDVHSCFRCVLGCKRHHLTMDRIGEIAVLSCRCLQMLTLRHLSRWKFLLLRLALGRLGGLLLLCFCLPWLMATLASASAVLEAAISTKCLQGSLWASRWPLRQLGRQPRLPGHVSRRSCQTECHD